MLNTEEITTSLVTGVPSIQHRSNDKKCSVGNFANIHIGAICLLYEVKGRPAKSSSEDYYKQREALYLLSSRHEMNYLIESTKEMHLIWVGAQLAVLG